MKNEKVIYLEDKEYPIELKRLKDPPKKIYTAGNIDLLKNNVFAPIINRNEVFLPSFTYLPHSVGMDFQKTVLTEDMYILYKILEKYYPEYLSVFSNYMTGNHRTGFNMFLII